MPRVTVFFGLPMLFRDMPNLDGLVFTASPGFAGTCQVYSTVYSLPMLCGDMPKLNGLPFRHPPLCWDMPRVTVFLGLPMRFGSSKVVWIRFYGLPRLYGDMPSISDCLRPPHALRGRCQSRTKHILLNIFASRVVSPFHLVVQRDSRFSWQSLWGSSNSFAASAFCLHCFSRCTTSQKNSLAVSLL